MKPLLTLVIAGLFLIGCKEEIVIDTTPPSPPQGIMTISLDNAVELQWYPSQAEDVEGYNVWVSDQYDGRYALLATVTATDYIDYGAENGVTYYYAISAFDFEKNESALSKDVIYDTPRPEGYQVVLSNWTTTPNTAGYDFSQYEILPYNDVNTDFFFENASGRFYAVVWGDTEIQDMGYTQNLDEISASPAAGWAPSKSAEAIVGHTYVIRTWNTHYAKIRVTEVAANRLVFDWAYQIAQGNRELKVANVPVPERKQLSRVRVME